MIATASIATPEKDARISKDERTKGAQAKLEGKSAEDCPWRGGLCEQWWLEGFNGTIQNFEAYPL